MESKNSCHAMLFLISLIVFSGFVFSGTSNPDETKDRKTLDAILKKTGDYCEKVKAIALFYVCREKVADERHVFARRNLLNFSIPGAETIKPRRIRTKTYVYDYQLVKKGEVPKEKRSLLEEDGKEKYEENVEFRPVKYYGTYSVYGPVGFLSKKWQEHYEYEIVGGDVIDDKKAIVIASAPKNERDVNYNFGRIWVDAEDFSILKIELDPRSIKDYEDELVQSPIGDLRKKVIWTMLFGIEKNGVRFPSQQIIQEFYVNSKGEELLIEKITFLYEDYKFFIVETEVKYE